MKAIRNRIVETKRVKASTLLDHPSNYRTHPTRQRAALEGAVADLGQVQAVTVRRTKKGLQLVDGHLRKAVWGDQEITVNVVDLDDEEAKKALVSLDPIAAMAGQNKEELAKLLALVSTEQEGLQRLLSSLGKSNRVGSEDSVVQLPKDPKTKPGDLWALGNHRLLCGDASDPSAIVKLIGQEDAPNLMVTDPPYGVNYDPEWRDGVVLAPGTSLGKVKNDNRADWTEVWHLFPGDVAYVWHSAVHSALVQQSLDRADFVVRAQIIWVKQMLQLSRGDYHWRHEPCFYAVRKGKRSSWTGDRKQTTVWEVQTALGFVSDQGPENKRTGHSTQKPVELFRRAILNNSTSGESVFDPFCGSGTAIIACEVTKRRAFAIELDQRYVRAAINRWEEFTGKKAKRL